MPDLPAGLHLRRVRPSEIEDVHALLSANGWAPRIGDKERFAGLLLASQRAEVALVEGAIVGFARAITDGLSNGYLSMVVVHADFRGLGIGRALVEHCMGADPEVTWMLRAGRSGAPQFFAKLGFEPSAIAMERRGH